MDSKLYTENEVLVQTRHLIHAVIDKKVKLQNEIISDKMIFIGDGEKIYTCGKAAFLTCVQEEFLMPQGVILDEEYAMLDHERRLWIIYGRFTIGDALYPQRCEKIHFTTVWKQVKDNLTLLHINANHAGGAVGEIPFEKAAPVPVSREPKIRFQEPGGVTHYMPASSILYFQADNTRCKVFTVQEGVRPLCKPLKEIRCEGFARIHRGYLVNLGYVRNIQRYGATLYDGTTLPISKDRYMEVKRQLQALNGGA